MSGSSFTSSEPLNLATHRTAARSVWDRPGWDGSADPVLARWLVGSAGSIMAIEGFRRRGAAGTLLAALGGALVWWGASADGLVTTRSRIAGAFDRVRRRSADAVQEASTDSFPASDAPSWTPTVGTSLRRTKRARP